MPSQLPGFRAWSSPCVLCPHRPEPPAATSLFFMPATLPLRARHVRNPTEVTVSLSTQRDPFAIHPGRCAYRQSSPLCCQVVGHSQLASVIGSEIFVDNKQSGLTLFIHSAKPVSFQTGVFTALHLR